MKSAPQAALLDGMDQHSHPDICVQPFFFFLQWLMEAPHFFCLCYYIFKSTRRSQFPLQARGGCVEVV